MPGGLRLQMMQKCNKSSILTLENKSNHMKTVRYSFFILLFTSALSSCSVWNKVFPAKYGCESNGKNVGAEKILDGSSVKKAKKFKA